MSVYVPGLLWHTVSVTFCMKMRPLSCSRVLPFLSTAFFDLFFDLLGLISLQHSRIIWNRYILYFVWKVSHRGVSRDQSCGCSPRVPRPFHQKRHS